MKTIWALFNYITLRNSYMCIIENKNFLHFCVFNTGRKWRLRGLLRGTHIQKLYTLSTCKLLTHSKKSSGYQFGLLVFLLISRSLPGLLCVHACKHRTDARSKSTDSSLFLHVARFYENRRSILTNQNTWNI